MDHGPRPVGRKEEARSQLITLYIVVAPDGRGFPKLPLSPHLYAAFTARKAPGAQDGLQMIAARNASRTKRCSRQRRHSALWEPAS